MATTLREFLSGLAQDRKELGAFIADPDQAMADAGLSDEDAALLQSRDMAQIQTRLMEDGDETPAPMLVVAAEDLQRTAQGGTVGLTLFPNQPLTMPIQILAPTFQQVSPVISPQITPLILPQVQPQITPLVVPQIQPQVQPQVTPLVLPQVQPQITPLIQPQVQPQITPLVLPQVQPQITPLIQPQISPLVWPQVTPLVMPQISPVFVPERQPQPAPQPAPTPVVTPVSIPGGPLPYPTPTITYIPPLTIPSPTSGWAMPSGFWGAGNGVPPTVVTPNSPIMFQMYAPRYYG